ncbi:MAG: hypothetical protein D6814_00040 [Calditrichaeota bacterium]|nr:MAG: hypothetical protein D6814_00040 [Calditrichota bacterium]
MKKTNSNCKEFDPETLKLIRNLKQMGRLNQAMDDLLKRHLADWFVSKNLLSFEEVLQRAREKNLVGFATHDIFDQHLQEWCIEHGIIGTDYIADLSIKARKG